MGDTKMRRRSFLAASAASLALPSVAQAQSKRMLKFTPFADLAILDPLATTASITLYHGYMLYDTLYGQTGQQFGFKCTPQMVEGHVVENDGKT
jgi:peptide/nickel transport system substrate-binding protein